MKDYDINTLYKFKPPMAGWMVAIGRSTYIVATESLEDAEKYIKKLSKRKSRGSKSTKATGSQDITTDTTE